MNEILTKITDRMNRYFVGKPQLVEDVICCFLAGGHLLLEDVPGVGKTTLAQTFAKTMGLGFGRIQFTPDTMPGDVTGLSVYDMKTGEFVYREGAIMRNIVLADELNRTSPKTQSALLEAMAESQVTVDGKVYPLPLPFMVIATQNPISFAGTFPLPEAQLDRFMMKLTIGYPESAEEIKMVRMKMDGISEKEAEAVLDINDLNALMEEVGRVKVSDPILSYIRDIVDKTRNDPAFILGASPRAFLHLVSAVRARAFAQSRDFVKPDDVKYMAPKVLAHRLVLSTEMRLHKKDSADILDSIINKVHVPVE